MHCYHVWQAADAALLRVAFLLVYPANSRPFSGSCFWFQLPVWSQEEEERKVRKEYRPPNRRTAQQLKADEDFAKRMQRQEQEIEKHELAHFREAQRRQMSQFDMGGAPKQDLQVCTGVIWFHNMHDITHLVPQHARYYTPFVA